MPRQIWLPLLLSSLGAAPVTTPSTAPTPQQLLAERKAAERKDHEQKIAGLPVLPARPINDLFQLSIETGELTIRPKMGRTDRSRVDVKGMAGASTIGVGGDQANSPEGATFVQFEHTDFSVADEVFHRIQVFASAASMQISCDADGLAGSKSISLIQSYNTDEPQSATRLYVQVFAPVTDELQTKLNLMAPNFVELRRRYPLEVRQYLDPMLRELQAVHLMAPDPKIAYQVFAADFRPDVELKTRIDAALAKFDAEDFKVRKSAAQALQQLGEPAALVLMRADRSGWSIDRSNGVEAFLAQFESQPATELSRLKSDPAFLLDCLYSEDASIRTKASTMLEKVTGKSIALDPNADLKSRAALIDRLYPSLFKPTTNPTTAP